MSKNPLDYLMVGIDKKTRDQALPLFDAVAEAGVTYVKIGPVLMLRMGLANVDRELKSRGITDWFFDGKFCNTDSILGDTAEAACEARPTCVNCMADSGPGAIMRFADVCRAEGVQSLVVSFLTTKSDDDCRAQHNGRTAKEQVLFYAHEWIAPAQADGMVCSALEARALRESGYKGLLYTPGIRFADTSRGDQKRVMTPADAITGGATKVIMASDILADPAPRVHRFIDEVGPVIN